ncbi:hypothetical protein FACS1894166_12240 [Bacilli bacterium]|nr:hypothetical protein FACS1894166_12240 [Bacilli bacterium]
MKLDEVFRAMQKTHDHIMLVVDSANQVIGIITNEELLEEITGEIFDETD